MYLKAETALSRKYAGRVNGWTRSRQVYMSGHLDVNRRRDEFQRLRVAV